MAKYYDWCAHHASIISLQAFNCKGNGFLNYYMHINMYNILLLLTRVFTYLGKASLITKIMLVSTILYQKGSMFLNRQTITK